MEIRSVTFFADPRWLPDDEVAADARDAFVEAGYRVQSTRLATTPFPDWLPHPAQVTALADWCQGVGIGYLTLGPVRLDDDAAYLDQLPDIFSAHETVFASAEVADTTGRIDIERVGQVAALVKQLATLRPDGFANLYFAAAANCPPGSPFFPVAYHGGEETCFALAVEAADLAVSACRTAASLAEAQVNLVEAIERESAGLARVAEALADRHELAFGGIDFTLASFPQEARSLGTALEALGVPAVGGHGSLFAAAFLAECVDRANFFRCGFSGLIFPVLEDVTLARRAAEGLLTINDLLLYSAVCGAGLDTVPLPEDVGVEELSGILLDLAALAVRLDKALTARLMPLPGLAAGDAVAFDYPYFADGRAMATKGIKTTGLLSGKERIVLQSRSSSQK